MKKFISLILISALILVISADAAYVTEVYDNYTLYEENDKTEIDSPLYDYELEYINSDGVKLKVNFYCFINTADLLGRNSDIMCFNCFSTANHSIQIYKGSSLISTIIPETGDSTCYNLPDYRMWIQAEYADNKGKVNIKVILIPISIAEYVFDISTNRVYLTASFPAIYKDSFVSVMLVDKYSSNVPLQIDDIGYFEQGVIKTSGDFATDFKFTQDINNYKAVLNIGGLKYEIEDVQIIDTKQEPEIKLDFTQKDTKVTAVLVVNDAFRGCYDNCVIVIAFYDDKDNLITVSKAPNYELSFSASIPQDAAMAKVLVWDGFINIMPYCGSISLELMQ